MDLSELCRKYPLIMRVVLAILMFTGIWFIIMIIIILIEYFEDYTDGISECFNYIIKGPKDE